VFYKLPSKYQQSEVASTICGLTLITETAADVTTAVTVGEQRSETGLLVMPEASAEYGLESLDTSW
jgi:hypothetical protein